MSDYIYIPYFLSKKYEGYTVLPRLFATLYNATLAYRQQITQSRFPTMITPPL